MVVLTLLLLLEITETIQNIGMSFFKSFDNLTLTLTLIRFLYV